MVGLGDGNGGVIRSAATAVSADGSIIVGTAEGTSNGGRWTAANGWTSLGSVMDQVTDFSPQGMSFDGSVVVGHGHPPQNGNVAARWTAASGVVNLGALPNNSSFPDAFLMAVSANGSRATGNSFGVDGVHPLYWSVENGLVGLGDVPGGPFYALGWDISGDGRTIVGSARTQFPQAPDEAFLWREDTGFILPDPNHGAVIGSAFTAVSGNGAVAAGYFSGPNGGGMIWDSHRGMRFIQDVLVNDYHLDLTGWLLGGAVALSHDGRVVVGNRRNPAGESEAWIARIPKSEFASLEPAEAFDDGGAPFRRAPRTVPEPNGCLVLLAVMVIISRASQLRRELG